MWPEASSLARTLMGVESLELSVGKVDGKFITGLPSGSLIYGFFCEPTCPGCCSSSKHFKGG